MKKMLSLIGVVLLCLSVVACGKSETVEPTIEEASNNDSAPTVEELKFPEDDIKVIVPFSPGGAVDTTNRILGAKVEEAIDSSIVIQNKPGGGAVVGQTYAVNQPADGYTLLALTSSFVSNIITKDTTYTVDSIEPVMMYCFDPEVLVVNADSDIMSVEDLIAKSKETPLIHSTPGNSTSHHIAGLVFSDLTGAQFDYLHTNGGANQVTQLAGGHAEVGMTIYATALPLVESGKIRILAVASEKRSDRMPDVPTFKELGYDFVYGAFRGIAAPAGTPKEVVLKLQDLYKDALLSDKVKTQFEEAGYPVEYHGSDDFKAYIKKNYESVNSMKDLLSK